MNDFEKQQYERQLMSKTSSGLSLMSGRSGWTLLDEFNDLASTVPGVNSLAQRLKQHGGLTQQERMIRDKRRTLDKAVLYSYQGAFVKKWYPPDMDLMEGVREQQPVRALINPNKVKQDYDDKIISIGYEHDFNPGDVFEWTGTNTYWLIYLQDLTELAYFRGQIRKCSYEIKWVDDDGNYKTTYAAVTGPKETRIDRFQKSGTSYDMPNWSLNIMLPKNEDTLKYFVRYAKFFLSDGYHQVCWKIEAVDAFSTPGIIAITALEDYANKDKDDLVYGVANGKVVESEPINTFERKKPIFIDGEGFIKPKREYEYILNETDNGSWKVSDRAPVKFTPFVTEGGLQAVKIKWDNNYSGQFDITCTVGENEYTKTIVVESLF